MKSNCYSCATEVMDIFREDLVSEIKDEGAGCQ